VNDADLAELYRDLRSYAFAIAYRMLGSVSEAEDVVQDAFVRISRADPGELLNPKAYLATVTTRLAMDALRSARMKRESYVGSWLPEPLVADRTQDVAAAAETADSLAMAFLVMLEKLSPVERAVFLLHDVFDHDYAEIASIVGKSEANCRQLARRARQRIEDGRPRFEASRQASADLTDRFLAACQDGDMTGLVTLLAGDVAFYGDGGGRAAAIERPLFGRENVARFLLGLFRRGAKLGMQMQRVEVNGQAGAKFLDAEGRLISVFTVDVADGAVQAIRSVVNPDKLGHLGALSPLAQRPRGAE
jgi:RNA polymerase sigma-70 factor, ECF subfamily